MSDRRFPKTVVDAVDRSKILGVRAGAKSDHRFIGIWPLVIGGRVYGRSWTGTADGWFATFVKDPIGVMQIDGRELRVRAVRTRSQRILDAMDRAYAAKYPTPGSAKYVRGFRTTRRRGWSVEFRPR